MTTETVNIIRKKNGYISEIEGLEHIEKLLNDFKKEELKNADEPFHYEAEIAAGLTYFTNWLTEKSKKK